MTAVSWSLAKVPDTGTQDEIIQIDNTVLKALNTFSLLLFCYVPFSVTVLVMTNPAA